MLNKALLASPKEFKISIGTQAHCSVQLSKTSAMPGDKITVTVNPATGYGNTTVGISTNGSVTKVNNTTFTFIMPFTDVVVNASASILSFRINVNKQGSGNVNVKSVANYGETVTVTVAPSNYWYFKSISASVALSGSGNSRTFRMPANDVTISVVFGNASITVTVGYHSNRSSVDGSRTYYFGYSKPGGYGSLSLIPYWESPNKYLRSIYYREKVDGSFMRGEIDFGDRTPPTAPSFNVLKANGNPLTKEESSLGSRVTVLYPGTTASLREFKDKQNQAIVVVFDPPPTGFL